MDFAWYVPAPAWKLSRTAASANNVDCQRWLVN